MKGAWKQSGLAAMACADLGYLGTSGGGGRARRAKLCIYVVAFAFAAFTAYLAVAPSLPAPSSPPAAWFGGLLASATPYRSQIANFFSSIFPTNSSSSPSPGPRGRGGFAANGGRVRGVVGSNRSSAVGSKQSGSGGGVANSSAGGGIGAPVPGGDSASGNATTAAKSGATTNNSAGGVVGAAKSGERGGVMSNGFAGNGNAANADTRIVVPNNQTGSGSGASSNNSVSAVPISNQTGIAVAAMKNGSGVASNGYGAPGNNQTAVVSPAVQIQNQSGSGASSSGSGGAVNKHKEATTSTQGSASSAKDRSVQGITAKAGNSAVLVLGNGSLAKGAVNAIGDMKIDWIKVMTSCDMFHGRWVRDDSYPLYAEGSCPHIDESFNCYLNGRPDQAYQKLRWQPNGCNIPRFNPADMLERLRGKRLVFVGDSLNRNMWESLVCILRNSIKDKTKVFEVSGRHEFRTEGSYSFLFMDYNCSVEFFRAPFLVQESEMTVNNGKTKETLRLDIIHQLSFKFKDAYILIFNTGHWWTHEKTSLGKDYYQEGNHVYSQLNVDDAFRKALSTWAKWIDANVNPNKTAVYFRGYSASHFSGGQWNSGGSCDKETEPITNEQYLLSYPPKMSILEDVIHGMKTPVVYLNITRMTDYRKDAHPSVFRKQKLTEEERRSPELYQDCSHWCLPGVPDSWNELLYAQILIKQHRMLHQ